MKSIAMLLFFALGTVLAEPQNTEENPPTTDQCTADLHAWYSTRARDAQKLRAADLQLRITVMSACKGMAIAGLPEYKALADDAIKYDTLTGTYDHAYCKRLFNFIKRHGELARFVKEDAAGKR